MIDPTVKKVRDLNGVELDSKVAIKKIKGSFGDEYIAKYRMGNIKDKYKCAICNDPLSLTNRMQKTDYFSHIGIVEDYETCPQTDKGKKLKHEDVDAIKNANQKEGKEHIRLKEIVANMINRDPSFSLPKVEQIIKFKTFNEKIKWRRPDVRANWKGINIVFEIQLQTILMYHIKGRREFYKKKKIPLMWIFKDLSISDFRTSHKDIFYTNNSNGFFINDTIARLSKKENKFMIGCMYIEWEIDKFGKYKKNEHSKIVTLEDVTFDNNGRVYYFDTEGERKKIEDEIFINTPVSKDEEFQYKNITFILKLATSGYFHIKYKNKKGKFIRGHYKGFFANTIEAKKNIVKLS